MPCSIPQSAGVSIHRVGIHRSFLKVLNSSKDYIYVLCYLPKENTHTLREIYFDFEYVSFKSLACSKVTFYLIAVQMNRAYVVNAFKRPLKIHIYYCAIP